MLSLNRIKWINSLKVNKYRKIHGQFIVEGTKVVVDLLKSEFSITFLFATSNWLDKHRKQIENLQITVEEVSLSDLKKISTLLTPSEVLCTVEIPHVPFNKNIVNQDFVLALESIRDPGNLGTIIRTADWFGINHIICSTDCVDVYNPKVIQATMGSITRVQVYFMDLVEIFKNKPRNIKVYGTMLEGENIHQVRFENNGLILIGNESTGISENLLPFLDKKIYIPSFTNINHTSPGIDSLNAAQACTVLCYEIRKQQA
ncbi:MAG: RNA methyltransferase [Bacteroidales bacterium]|nr:RNA methyltransferase [Bacteroidales bacterium]